MVGGEHQLVFYDAGWNKQSLRDYLLDRLTIKVSDVTAGRAGLGGLTDEGKK